MDVIWPLSSCSVFRTLKSQHSTNKQYCHTVSTDLFSLRHPYPNSHCLPPKHHLVIFQLSTDPRPHFLPSKVRSTPFAPGITLSSDNAGKQLRSNLTLILVTFWAKDGPEPALVWDCVDGEKAHRQHNPVQCPTVSDRAIGSGPRRDSCLAASPCEADEAGMIVTRSPVSAAATSPTTTVTVTAAATSPRPSRGAPHGRFHYAPTPSPREAASRIPAPSSRRQSTTAPATSSTSLSVPIQSRHAPVPVASSPAASSPSPGSPPSSRPRRWAGVDVATQYSPMEPMDYTTGALLSSRAPASSNNQAVARDPVESQPPHIPTSVEPMASHEEQASASASTSAAAAAPIPHGPTVAVAVPPTPPVSSAAPQPHPVSQTPQTGTPVMKRRNSQGDVTHSQVEAASAGQSGPHSPKRARLAPKIVPRRYEHCPVEDLVVLIAHMLGELIELNDEQAQKAGQRHNLTRFHSR